MITAKLGHVNFENIMPNEEGELFADLASILDHIRKHYGDATYAHLLICYTEYHPLKENKDNE